MTPMNAETKLALGSRWRSSAAVWASTSAGLSESHVRASTKKRTIELERGDLEALPADVADEDRGRAARHRPRTEDVAAADVVAGGLVDEPDLQAGQRRRRPGTKPRVSAWATRRSRWKSSALAIAPAAARANATTRSSRAASNQPGLSELTFRTPNSRGPSVIGMWTNDSTCSRATNSDRKRSASAASER